MANEDYNLKVKIRTEGEVQGIENLDKSVKKLTASKGQLMLAAKAVTKELGKIPFVGQALLALKNPIVGVGVAIGVVTQQAIKMARAIADALTPMETRLKDRVLGNLDAMRESLKQLKEHGTAGIKAINDQLDEQLDKLQKAIEFENKLLEIRAEQKIAALTGTEAEKKEAEKEIRRQLAIATAPTGIAQRPLLEEDIRRQQGIAAAATGVIGRRELGGKLEAAQKTEAAAKESYEKLLRWMQVEQAIEQAMMGDDDAWIYLRKAFPDAFKGTGRGEGRDVVQKFIAPKAGMAKRYWETETRKRRQTALAAQQELGIPPTQAALDEFYRERDAQALARREAASERASQSQERLDALSLKFNQNRQVLQAKGQLSEDPTQPMRLGPANALYQMRQQSNELIQQRGPMVKEMNNLARMLPNLEGAYAEATMAAMRDLADRIKENERKMKALRANN